MYHFQYVSKSETRPLKKELIDLMQEVQKQLQGKLKFQYRFVGSESRNMVTWDAKSNVGFDFDVNIMVHEYRKK